MLTIAIYVVVSFTNMFVFPFAYALVSNLIYGMTYVNGITVIVNLAIFAGCISLTFNNDIVVFSGLCAGAFIVFFLFVVASLFGRLSGRLEGKLRVCESCLFLVMGNVFGKYVLFVWDECQAEDVYAEENEMEGDILIGEDSIEYGYEEEKAKKYEPSCCSKMTFNKAFASVNNAWKESSLIPKDNNDVSLWEEEGERNEDAFSFRKNEM